MNEPYLPYASISVTDHPWYAVIVEGKKPEYGYGVLSYHETESEADANSLVSDGMVVPIDYRPDGGMIIPHLSRVMSLPGLYTNDDSGPEILLPGDVVGPEEDEEHEEHEELGDDCGEEDWPI